MERLVTRIGTGEAVPLKIDLDFVFDLDKRTFDGLKEIFSQLCTLTDILGDDYDLDELKDIKKRAEYADNTEKRANRYKAMVLDLLGDDCDLDRLRELVEADRDGRCVVLPCKVGDTVWMIARRETCHVERWVVYQVYKKDGGGWYFKLKNNMLSKSRPNEFEVCTRALCRFGKTVFLTREAAEAALKGDLNGN